jgi:MoxR-like ATPase
VVAVQSAVAQTHASEAIRRYVVSLLDETRRDVRTELGGSPRAGLMLLRAAIAHAALDGRDHVLPDDVQELAHSVLAHRLLLAPGVPDSERHSVIDTALAAVPAL